MKTIAGLTAVIAITALLTGCKGSGDPENVSYGAISGNLTPELMGLAERPIDVDRNIWMAANQNKRAFWGDLGRALYTNHPSTLSPYPIELTSGEPR